MFSIDTVSVPYQGTENQPAARWAGRFVKVCHWALAASFVIAWASDCLGALHQGAGVLALALVLLRVWWGVVVGTQGRPDDGTKGAAMVLILLTAVGAAGLTGWMLTLDDLRGHVSLALAHMWAVDLTVVAIGVHMLDTLFGGLALEDSARR